VKVEVEVKVEAEIKAEAEVEKMKSTNGIYA